MHRTTADRDDEVDEVIALLPVMLKEKKLDMEEDEGVEQNRMR